MLQAADENEDQQSQPLKSEEKKWLSREISTATLYQCYYHKLNFLGTTD